VRLASIRNENVSANYASGLRIENSALCLRLHPAAQIIMRRFLVLGFSFLVSGDCSHAVAGAKPSYIPIQIVGRDERIAHDVAVFNFRQIAAPQTWVVADVKPDPRGSYSTIPGAYIDGNTGKMISPPDARLVIVVRGSIAILSTLSGKVTPMTHYEWQARPVIEVSSRGRKEGGTYFFHDGLGGTTIVRINEKAAADQKFSPAYLIPREWASFVAPALKTKALPTLRIRDFDSAAYARLQAVLSDPNPFVAIEAARTLEQVQLLDADFVRGPLLKSRGFEQSAFACLVLRQLSLHGDVDLPYDGALTSEVVNKAIAKSLAKEPLLEDFGKAIDGAPDAQTLKSLATGISASVTEPSHFVVTTFERARWLLRRVDARQKALGTHTAADAYLDLLLQTSGVRETPAAPRK